MQNSDAQETGKTGFNAEDDGFNVLDLVAARSRGATEVERHKIEAFQLKAAPRKEEEEAPRSDHSSTFQNSLDGPHTSSSTATNDTEEGGSGQEKQSENEDEFIIKR
ncbi:hypothetical protein SEMRO_519_G158960.1 [Seminavis robusta]|uniref:Uncharacterized protein n=1 Tax=Seminavis robusta TaxID=568900 RepID=A0A9N8E161_9STRA|nr:hypothetical protein SEMRO_519_G158960.1 [Seminavis robusta]|eukprot:Sro519_g158960.1 n/a (107) ;mRNA; f:20163-20483